MLRWSRLKKANVSILVLALATGGGRQAQAAACCVSATSFGVGRLLIWEDFAAGIQLGHARILGQWDASSVLRWNPSDYSEGVSQIQPWAIVRLHERVQLQGWVPVLVNDRWSGAVHQVAGGLGDIGAAARFEFLAIGALRGFPSFALTGATTAPTGHRVEQTSPPLFAGTTGRGAWSGSLAIESEYPLAPYFLRLDASLTSFRSFDRSDTGQRQQYGPLLRAAISTGREIIPGKVVVALAALGEWERALRLGGVAVAESQSHLYSLAVSLSWRYQPHWTLVATVSNSVWPGGGGMNQDARIGVTLGARYGHF